MSSHEFDDGNDERVRKEGQHCTHTISKFGTVVKWYSDRHYGVELLEKYRLVGDVELDGLLQMSSTGGEEEDGLQLELDGRFSNTISFCRDVYLQHQHKHKHKHNQRLSECEIRAKEFYSHYHDCVPHWVNWDQIQRGMDVYVAFAPVAAHSLYYFALIPGFSIPKIAKVLERTRYLCPPSKTEQIVNRLVDTGGFLFNVMLPDENGLSAGPLRPGGKAWTMALQVRALHAKVRRSILQSSRNKWNINENGIPINQEDLAATLLAFSVNVLAAIDSIAGKPLPVSSQLDYLALWRYVGWLLGVESREEDIHLDSFEHDVRSKLDPLDPCGTRVDGHTTDGPIIHSRALMESIICHLMHPNESSRNIAHHLLCLGNQENPSNKSFGFLFRSFMCRRYIGDHLADELELQKPNMKDAKEIFANLLTLLFLCVARVYTLLIMKSKMFRGWAYARHLRVLKKFDRVWSEKHGKRMHKAAQDAMGHKDSQSNRTSPVPCPFALVMPPMDEKGKPHDKED